MSPTMAANWWKLSRIIHTRADLIHQDGLCAPLVTGGTFRDARPRAMLVLLVIGLFLAATTGSHQLAQWRPILAAALEPTVIGLGCIPTAKSLSATVR